MIKLHRVCSDLLVAALTALKREKSELWGVFLGTLPQTLDTRDIHTREQTVPLQLCFLNTATAVIRERDTAGVFTEQRLLKHAYKE